MGVVSLSDPPAHKYTTEPRREDSGSGSPKNLSAVQINKKE
jgi:hypothetical protein